MMKLPIIDSLRTLRGRSVVKNNRYLTFKQDLKFSPEAGHGHCELVTSAEARMVQIVSEYEIATAKIDVMGMAEERAKKAIVHEIYGPVIDRMRLIMHGCWERGDDEAAAEISQLIEDLKV